MTRHTSFIDTVGHRHCVNVADIVHLTEQAQVYGGITTGTVVYLRAPGSGHPGWEILATLPMAWFEGQMAGTSSVSGQPEP